MAHAAQPALEELALGGLSRAVRPFEGHQESALLFLLLQQFADLALSLPATRVGIGKLTSRTMPAADLLHSGSPDPGSWRERDRRGIYHSAVHEFLGCSKERPRIEYQGSSALGGGLRIPAARNDLTALSSGVFTSFTHSQTFPTILSAP